MPKLIYLVPAIFAAGCAAHRVEMPPQSSVGSVASAGGLIAQVDIAPAAAAETPTEALQVKTVEFEELDNGLVCEPRQRSASRITRRVCYTREEYAAVQALEREQAQEYARDLSRDREWREAQERMEQERRRSTPGL
jgi:hypothetical protein